MQSLSPSPPAASCWTRQCSSRPHPHPSAPGDNSRSYSRSVRRLWPPAYTEGEKLHERALSLQTLLQVCGEPAGTVCRAEKHRAIICHIQLTLFTIKSPHGGLSLGLTSCLGTGTDTVITVCLTRTRHQAKSQFCDSNT